MEAPYRIGVLPARRWTHRLSFRAGQRFEPQHERLATAARRHGLPANPLAGLTAEQLVQAAVQELMSGRRFTENDVASVLPPVAELLP